MEMVFNFLTCKFAACERIDFKTEMYKYNRGLDNSKIVIKSQCRGSSVVERSPKSLGLSVERRIEKPGEFGESL